MSKNTKYEKEKNEEIYDVLKDNPRWMTENEKKSAEKKPKNHPNKRTKDISVNVVNKKDDYFYDDSLTELSHMNSEEDFHSEDYLTRWRNEETEKKNKAEFERKLQQRKNKNFKIENSKAAKIRGILIFGAVLICGLSVYAISADIYTRLSSKYEATSAKEIETLETMNPAKLAKDETNTENDGKYTAAGVANKVNSSVVSINSYISQKDLSKGNANETASGLVITSDGMIVTNNHVLKDAEYINVVTADGDKYKADILGQNVQKDLAVLKIDAVGLQTVEPGNSDKLLVGEKVVAIGNPAGLSGTVTDGIISALDRKVRFSDSGAKISCIQTNAEISPGNSGGALCNMYGQVIGIVTTKYSDTGDEGLGFAIPINDAVTEIKKLTKQTNIDSDIDLGFSFIAVNDNESRKSIKSDYGIELPSDFNGLFVTNISTESNVSKTDLKVNDFIVGVDGKDVSDYDEAAGIFNSYDEGDNVTLSCARFDTNGTKKEFEVDFAVRKN